MSSLTPDENQSSSDTIDYPLSLGSILQRPEETSTFIIFGASGDLTKRKIIPALYNLACADLLPSDFNVIGFAVTPMDDNSFRENMREAVRTSKEATKFNPKVWEDFARRLKSICPTCSTGDPTPGGPRPIGGPTSSVPVSPTPSPKPGIKGLPRSE